ncbi:MAG: DUF4349 domain-containing protein [Candidatus Omnitrophica bacterium]|nr:DUF4349 domain-containing protein [Candidatus Omnitrophota bacterium]
MSKDEIKILISQAVDGEQLTDAQNTAIAEALRDSADLRAYEAQLLRLKQAMDLWPGIGSSSPDWEQRMDKTMARLGIKEEKKMNQFKFLKGNRVAVLMVTLVIVGGISLQMYSQRAIQARVRDASGYMASSSTSLGQTTQYEPYYERSSYQGRNVNGRAMPANSGSPALEVIDRKIIRTVDLKLLVKNYLQAQSAIINSVRKFEGLVLNSQVSQYANGSNGNVVFQVLPKNLDAVILEIKSFGELQSETSKADDVTGQYVDTEARLKNMRAVRDRLSQLVAERTAKVTDILEVERELTRVTGEIEAMEARLKYLAQTSAMATVTVNFYEKPIVQVARGFSIVDSFRGTLRTAMEVGVNTFNAVIIVIGFLVPVAFWSLLIWVAYLIWKKVTKK